MSEVKGWLEAQAAAHSDARAEFVDLADLLQKKCVCWERASAESLSRIAADRLFPLRLFTCITRSHLYICVLFLYFRLWHQFQSALLNLRTHRFFTNNNNEQLMRLHENVVSKCSKNLAQTQYVMFSVSAAEHLSPASKAIEFLQSILKEVSKDAQAAVLAKSALVLTTLATKDLNAALKVLDEAKREVDAFPGMMYISICGQNAVVVFDQWSHSS